jgi:splicing factor, arginine/serine-rich 16
MWHEARKQEKKIRGMIVDYRKRADRRKEFYEKIVSRRHVSKFVSVCTNVFHPQRADPVQFLQLHGRKSKIHYDVTDVSEESHM